MADYNSAYTGVQIDENIALAATATQPGDLATVATSGAYADLTGKPTLGTAAATASTDYATAAQGTLADSATQPGDDAADLGSGSATDGYVLTADGAGGAAWEAAAGGGGTPGGTDTQVQFNDGGAFGGDSGFTFDKTNNTLNVTGATITASDPIIDMAQTWNNAAVTFTAIKANVTDTASAAGSLLMDLQVGGVSQFSVGKGGIVTLPSSSNSTAPTLRVSGGGASGFGSQGGFDWFYTRASSQMAFFGFNRFCIGAGSITWASAAGGTADILLTRDAANTLAQRNGVNAQAFNLYGSYTDGSNYRRIKTTMSTAGVAEIKPEGAGTGVSGNVLHISGLPTSNPGPGILWNNAGTPAIGT